MERIFAGMFTLRFASLPVAALLALSPLAARTRPPHQPAASIGALRLLGEVILPFNQEVQGTKLGGISGLDRAPDGTWYLISDDKGEFSPARFHTARLRYNAQGFQGVDITGVHYLQPPAPTATPEYLDPESIRYAPRTHSLFYTSEGNELLKIDPFVREMDTTGRYRRTLPLPPMFRFQDQAAGTGPRQNATFEGLAYTPDDHSLWVLMEGPLKQDRPDDAPATAEYPNRFSQLDSRTGALCRQLVYELDPVSSPGHVNRNAEVVAVSDTEFLALECSYYKGENRVRVYDIDTQGATDVSGQPTLRPGTYRPVRKRLVADLGQLGRRLDNIEGLAFGPNLPNGHRTLVVVSDNNFNPAEISQFWAFEVLPSSAAKP